MYQNALINIYFFIIQIRKKLSLNIHKHNISSGSLGHRRSKSGPIKNGAKNIGPIAVGNYKCEAQGLLVLTGQGLAQFSALIADLLASEVRAITDPQADLLPLPSRLEPKDPISELSLIHI